VLGWQALLGFSCFVHQHQEGEVTDHALSFGQASNGVLVEARQREPGAA
jgi:hypothetical protein